MKTDARDEYRECFKLLGPHATDLIARYCIATKADIPDLVFKADSFNVDIHVLDFFFADCREISKYLRGEQNPHKVFSARFNLLLIRIVKGESKNQNIESLRGDIKNFATLTSRFGSDFGDIESALESCRKIWAKNGLDF